VTPAQPDGVTPAQPDGVTLLAEDLLLLLLDDATGRPLLDATRLDRALAGALLLDLALAERVGAPPAAQRFGRDRIAVLDGRPTGDPLLDDALARLGSSRPPGAARAVERLVKGTRPALLARVAAAGLVREERRAVLGIFPSVRWPAANPECEVEVRRALHEALVEGRPPDTRTAALVSLLAAVDAVPKVVSAPDRRALARRAREIAEGEWAGDAVRRAVRAVQSALIASVTAATTVAAVTSS
jgi:Golgi phosphoprotein 3 (GPP34)